MNKIEVTDELLYELVPKVEKCLLDQLPSDKELSHTFSKAFKKKKMKKLIKENRDKYFIKSFKKIAVAFLIIVSIILTTVMSVEALGAKMFKIIKEIYKELSSISFVVDNDDYSLELIVMEPKYIPKGFEKTDTEILYTMIFIIYNNKDGEEIIYRQSKITNGTSIIDTENAEIEDILINGYKGQIVLKNGTNHLIWFDEEYFYSIRSTIKKEELIKMAESIK
ncbi:DUF4367 domain-containing protein [Tissierella praeacuta]|uniref:DUF4367 domain-containing protein n=1 Tax=Tissierella praeacuta TaxID=43131 RepID=UPI0033427D0C